MTEHLREDHSAVSRDAAAERAARTQEVNFAGDSVALSGQIDYPSAPPPVDGYPLLFILHHAGGNTRAYYAPYAELALDCGYAVFRWDRRGTGRSGSVGRGSTTQDAVNAYEVALEQPQINRKRTVIAAFGGGSGMLGSAYGLFARVERPYAALLIGSVLTAAEILAIDTRLHIAMGEENWHPTDQYGASAVQAHQAAYPYGATLTVVPHANRLLLTAGGRLDGDAREALATWLQAILHRSSST